MSTQNTKAMKHDKQWFLDRIGKRVFRDADSCDCQVCASVVENGLIISDDFHAMCLFHYQNELGLNYYDTKPVNQNK